MAVFGAIGGKSNVRLPTGGPNSQGDLCRYDSSHTARNYRNELFRIVLRIMKNVGTGSLTILPNSLSGILSSEGGWKAILISLSFVGAEHGLRRSGQIWTLARFAAGECCTQGTPPCP